MIDVYLVRHGETGGNVAKRHQAERTRLTERGRQQAIHLRAWLQKLDPTMLLVSNRVRALETAELMLEGHALIPETDDLFVELERPRAVYGQYRKSARSLWYIATWYFGLAGGDGSDEQGESYAVFRQRLAAARDKLQALPDGSCVVVVSHSVFISFFCAHLCHDGHLPLMQAPGVLWRIMRMSNTGIVHLQYDQAAGEGACAWQLIGQA